MRLIDADALNCRLASLDQLCRTDKMSALLGRVLFIVSKTPTVGGWISVKDRMPPDSNHVLARCEIHGLYKPKGYTCVAFYAKKNSVSAGDYPDDGICCEYDE